MCYPPLRRPPPPLHIAHPSQLEVFIGCLLFALDVISCLSFDSLVDFLLEGTVFGGFVLSPTWHTEGLKSTGSKGTWEAQSVKCLTLDFSSGHDITVHGFEPCPGLYADGTEPTWDPLSLSLCPSPAYALSLSLSLSK